MIIIGNEDSPGGDYAALRQRLINMGITTYIFHDHSATRSLGIHIANVFNTPDFFRVAQLLTVVEDYWTPQSCIDDAVTLLEGVCEGQYEDRKSTRLNSSHVAISYAVFCLKKKKSISACTLHG